MVKNRWLIGLTLGLTSAAALSTTVSLTTNLRIAEVLTITNDAIDVSDSRLSDQFRKTFTNLYGDQVSDLANRNDLIQLILKELITYGDQASTIKPIFSTKSTFSDFYYKFSQIQNQIVDPDNAIVFSYGDQGDFKNLAAGILKVNITIGKNLKNEFSFATGKNEATITFYGLQSQYDWYQRTTASGQDNWNVDNVADDHLVNPYQLPNRMQTTLWNDIKTLQDPEQFVYDHLIKYEHHNGQAISGINQDPNLANHVLATNLDQKQLKAAKVIEKVVLEPFFASGKIHLQIKIKQSPWRQDKMEILNDQFGTWKAIKGNWINLWVGGWKKDYSFATKMQNDQVIQFDSQLLTIGTENLNQWSAIELVEQINQDHFEVIDQALINFSDYLNPDQANKLINTRLRYQEWKTIGAKLNYQVVDFDQWSGKLKLKVDFDPKWSQLHFIEPLGKGFQAIKQRHFIVEFINLKPDQNFNQVAKSVHWNWLNQSTISDWFAITNEHQIDFDQISKVIKTKLVNYNNWNRDDLLFTTNAPDANALVGFQINNFIPNWKQGLVQIDWSYQIPKQTSFNGRYYDQGGIIEDWVTISGFQSQINQQYNFGATSPDLELEIDDFNQTNQAKPIYFASQIDERWIINNLINFADQGQKPHALFTTNASLKAFNEDLLVANGIRLHLSSDQSYLDGTITINRLALSGNFNQDQVFHFRIKGLVAKNQVRHDEHLSLSDVDLDQIDRQWVFNNLISFTDQQVINPTLVVNQSRQIWLTNSFQNLIIEKSYANHQALIRFQFQNQPDLVTTISDLQGKPKWVFNDHIVLKNQAIVNYQSGSDLVTNLVNFDNQFVNEQVWLNTNVSQSEFFNTYFQAITIKDRNLYQNYLEFAIVIANQGWKTIRVEFNQNDVNIFDFNPYYGLSGYNLNQINLGLIEQQIDFAGSRINQPSWFRTNLTKAQFQKWMQWKLIENESAIGALKLKLTSQVNFNFDDLQAAAVAIDHIELRLFGFAAGGQFNFETTVNANLNQYLKTIENANQLNEAMIYDHLITYDGYNLEQAAIASTNLTKAQFQSVAKVKIEIKDHQAIVWFNFASALNQGQLKQARIVINNLGFVRGKWTQFEFNIIIIVISVVIILAIGGGWWGWQIKRRQKAKAIAFKHQLKQQNRLL